ncbi:hypothetical protein, partial [Nocardioides sp.]|uniref:DUF7507 domain-containing protein n=1 Tax=Nocardioides sp. TaxID=35761 RepID=UPI002735FEB3
MSAPLSCTTVYAVQGSDPHNIYSVNTATGAMTSVGTITASGTTNALGISADGVDVYTSNGANVWHYDTDTGVTTQYPGSAGAGSTHGAVNPATGVFYYGGVSGGSANIYGFNTTTNTSLGLVATVALDSAPGGNGDWAFDSQGNLYLTAGSGAGDNSLYVVSEQLPTTSGPAVSLGSSRIAQIDSAGNPINGVAFGPGGFIYLASNSAILRVNPSSGAVAATTSLSPSGQSVDLGSCTTPSTITVRKDIDGRFAPTDQFQVSVTGGGLTTGNTGTTTGTDDGLQTAPGEVAGPVLGLEGTTYDIAETGQGGADLANYATEWACVNAAAGNAPVSSGTGASGSFTMPSPDGGTGAVVECTFTNTALISSLQLQKSAGTPVDLNNNGITDEGDTIAFTFTLTNDGTVPLSALAVSDPLVGAVTCEDTNLAPGASTECGADELYVVTAADEVNGSVDNTATASGEDPDGEEVPSNEDSTTTPAEAADPVLTLEKLAGTPVDVNNNGLTDAGDTIAFSFVVTNEGNVPLSGIVVSDPLVGAVTCEATSLAPGASTECTADAVYVVTEADEDAGSVDNTASATGEDPGGEEVPSNDDSTTTPTEAAEPVLTLEKLAGAPVDVNNSGLTDAGDTIVFTFVVTNDGNVPLSGIVVSDPKVGTVTCEATTLAPGASTECAADAVYVVTEADEDAGSVDNTASATG